MWILRGSNDILRLGWIGSNDLCACRSWKGITTFGFFLLLVVCLLSENVIDDAPNYTKKQKNEEKDELEKRVRETVDEGLTVPEKAHNRIRRGDKA